LLLIVVRITFERNTYPMNEEEKAFFQTETGRLNKIISVVLEQNELLKAELSYLKTYMLQNNLALPDPKTGIGQLLAAMSYDKTGVWHPPAAMSNDKTGMGQLQDAISDPKIGVGQQHAAMPYDKTDVGQLQVAMSYGKSDIGQLQTPKPLPEIYPNDNDAITRLSTSLRASGFTHVPYTARRNAAKLLIHFYNKGRSDYTELRKITELSQGGLSKFMTSLRRRGLIRKGTVQKHEPTAHALQLMQKAFR